MAFGDFRDFPRRTASGKVLHNKAFNIAKYLNYDGYQHAITSVVYKLFAKRLLVVLLKAKSFGTNN